MRRVLAAVSFVGLFACGVEQEPGTALSPLDDTGILAITPSAPLWPLEADSVWRFERDEEVRELRVLEVRDGLALLEGLFAGEPRWIAENGGAMLRTSSSTYQVQLDEGACGLYEVALRADDASVSTPVAEFLRVHIYDFARVPNAFVRCEAPHFYALALARGVGPVALDLDGSGLNHLLTYARLGGASYPTDLPTYAPATLPADVQALDGQLVSIRAKPRMGEQTCTKRLCRVDAECCNTCMAPYMAGHVELDGGATDVFGCTGNTCRMTCEPLDEDVPHVFTGIFHYSKDLHHVLEVVSHRPAFTG